MRDVDVQLIRNTEPPRTLRVRVRATDQQDACETALWREFLGAYDGPDWPPAPGDDDYTIDALQP